MSWPTIDPKYYGGVLLPPKYIPAIEEREPAVDQAQLHAYDHCNMLTRIHSKSFFFSTRLLPAGKRQAIRVLYAFCRTTDDLVDLNPATSVEELQRWRSTLSRPARTDDPVPFAWAQVRRQYQLVDQLEADLLAGVEMDLSINRYATFTDLWLYCYRVAAVVGLLSMQIIGYAEGAAPYAIKLGVALQLTNILRDIGEDAARNRIYLPREDLERFGVSEHDILYGVRNARTTALLQFEIDRAHQLYEESWRGIGLLHPNSRLAVATAATVYRGILDKIVANDYDVWQQRAHLSLGEKLGLLPRIAWRLRALNRDFPSNDWGSL